MLRNPLRSALCAFLVLLMAAGCDLGVQPYDGKPPEQALDDIEGLRAATLGNYHLFVGEGYNTYNKYQHFISEFPGDNVALSGTTTDPLFFVYNYDHTTNMGNIRSFWRWSYQIIYGTNRVVEAVEAGASEEQDQLLGENLFMRALTHLHLASTFGRPYAQGRDNLGVPIVTSATPEDSPARSTVGEVYDAVVADLERAASLMTAPRPSSFASQEVAEALLARVHLYREENEQAIEYATGVIESGRYELAERETYARYNEIPNEGNPETIFAIRHTETDDHGFGAIGSMYYKSPGGVGWGEMYASKEYRDLLAEHPEDLRSAFVEPNYLEDENDEVVYENGEPVVEERNGYPIYYVTKFSNQGGNPTLSSPVVLRLAEMYLIRAEANAKLGSATAALEDLNRIRGRAGLSGDALYATGDLDGNGSALDAVLEERRLELAFEGHRRLDVFRNGRAMRRTYPGTHLSPNNPGVDMSAGTQVIPADHPRVVFFIPEEEVKLNPNLEQNP